MAVWPVVSLRRRVEGYLRRRIAFWAKVDWRFATEWMKAVPWVGMLGV